MLLGIYLTFFHINDDYVLPSLKKNENESSTDIISSYKFYTDLVAMLNIDTKITKLENSASQISSISKNKKSRSIKRRITRQFLTEDFASLKAYESQLSGNHEFDDIDDFIDEKNDYFNHSGYNVIAGNSVNKENIFFDQESHELIGEKDTESNAKLFSYLDELIELIVRDFILVFLENFIWDKEKIAALAKYYKIYAKNVL